MHKRVLIVVLIAVLTAGTVWASTSEDDYTALAQHYLQRARDARAVTHSVNWSSMSTAYSLLALLEESRKQTVLLEEIRNLLRDSKSMGQRWPCE